MCAHGIQWCVVSCMCAHGIQWCVPSCMCAHGIQWCVPSCMCAHGIQWCVLSCMCVHGIQWCVPSCMCAHGIQWCVLSCMYAHGIQWCVPSCMCAHGIQWCVLSCMCFIEIIYIAIFYFKGAVSTQSFSAMLCQSIYPRGALLSVSVLQAAHIASFSCLISLQRHYSEHVHLICSQYPSSIMQQVGQELCNTKNKGFA